MMEIDIEEAIDEILESIDVDRETVEKDLRKFLDYGVPLEHAKQAVINKYGSVVKEKKLKDIKKKKIVFELKNKEILTKIDNYIQIGNTVQILTDNPYNTLKKLGIKKEDVKILPVSVDDILLQILEVKK